MGGKRKVKIPLPEGFPAIGSYVSYYSNGWYHGTLKAVKGNQAIIERFIGRDVKIPLGDVEIPVEKGA
jgi:hypothetical protein